MKINQNCPLVINNLYLYDFEACYWNILKRLDYDLNEIEYSDKKKRNIQIGILQKENPVLSQYLYRTAEDLVSEFIYYNDIQEDNIIVQQRDGIILTKPLVRTKISDIEFKERDFIEFIIISSNRKMFIYKGSDNQIHIKGVSFLYDKIKQYYQKFCNFNFLNKSILCNQLFSFRNNLKKQHPSFFCIPYNEDSYSIFLIGEGQVIVNKRSLKLISIKNIDIDMYFKHYFKPFTESIFLEFLI